MTKFITRIHTRVAIAVLITSSMTGLTVASDSPPPGLTLEQKGYWLILNKAFEYPLLSETEYDSLWTIWPEPLRSKAEKATPKERRLMALERYGFQESPDRPKGDIPQQFTLDNNKGLTTNCLACHGGKVNGKVVLGLGNSHINLTTFSEDITSLYVKLNKKITLPPKIVPIPAQVPVRGVNNAFGDALAYLIVRDKNLNLTPDKLQFPAPPPESMKVSLDTPPYWNVYHKQNLYYDGFVQKSHRDIMQFAFNYQASPEKIKSWDDDFKAIFAWINSLRSPKYPFKIDNELAEKGKKIYKTNCTICHGTSGANGYFPEKSVDIDEVDTDPARTTLSLDFKKYLVSTWVGYFGETPVNLTQNTYVAPPLDGVWATAPYLHNGSVPTLWHLLNPDKRPSIWLRTEDGYDQSKVGLEISDYTKLPDTAKTAQEQRLYYQTNLYGLSNKGHRYPKKGLTPEETQALLEYLKTL